MYLKYILIFSIILISVCYSQERSHFFCGTSAINNINNPDKQSKKSTHQYSAPIIGEKRTFWSAGYGFQSNREVIASCQAIGKHCYVFVEDTVWGQDSTITIDEINSLLTAFEIGTSNESIDSSKSIFDIQTEYFGPIPDEIDDDDKIYILFLNTIAGGYFSSSNQEVSSFSNQVEMLYIAADINYRYKSQTEYHKHVLAHELMHLIHWGQSRLNRSWINEGCAEYAAYISGYYEPGTEDTLSYHNLANYSNLSLTNPDNAMYYPLSFTFMLYLSEQFGGVDIIKEVISADSKGISTIDEAIMAKGYVLYFDNIFHKWQLAIFLDHLTLSNTSFGFNSIDIPPFIPRHSLNDLNSLQINDTINSWAGHIIDLNDIHNIKLTIHVDPGIFSYLFSNSSYNLVELEPDSENVLTLNISENDNLTLLLSNKSGIQNSYHIKKNITSSITDMKYPQEYKLSQNYPNPFNPNTIISYTLPKFENVKIEVFDLNGRLVSVLVNEKQLPGTYLIEYSNSLLANGLYIYRLQTDNFISSKKMVLLK